MNLQHASGAIACVACLLGAGCTRITDDMARQPRTNPAASSAMFTDQEASRPPVAGTVVRSSGDLAWVSSGRSGLDPDTTRPPAVDAALLARGRERYRIYCLPCHGDKGEGDGEVVRRGFPAPAPFGSVALRAAPDARLHEAIRHGTGAMYPFADRVSAADAWAIVAYLRTLQLLATPMARSAAGPTPEGAR